MLRQEQPPSVVHHEKALSLNFLAKFAYPKKELISRPLEVMARCLELN